MSEYTNFTKCASYVVALFEEFVKDNQRATVGDFFNHAYHADLVNHLVVTYHDEIFTTAGNNFLASERVPAGIVTLAKKRGVDFPRGFSIANDEHAYEVFLMRIKNYRESQNLTRERVKEIRNQNRDQIGAHEEQKRARMGE